MRDRAGQVVKLAGEVRDRAERTIFWRVWERMLENEFVDRGVALAAKAFVSLFPAVIVAAAFAPPSVRAAIAGTIARRTGLSGPGLATFRSAYATSSSVRRATGVLGLVFMFYYVNSFTSALQRAYIRAWRRPPSRDTAGDGFRLRLRAGGRDRGCCRASRACCCASSYSP